MEVHAPTRSANPRPDALMKEQLTEMTGLSQRVIRVWFQNKRCKEKKRMHEVTKVSALGEEKSTMNSQRQNICLLLNSNNMAMKNFPYLLLDKLLVKFSLFGLHRWDQFLLIREY